MNTYWLNNAGGQRQKIGEADDQHIAGADAIAIGMWGDRPLLDPNGGRPISVGRVWVERTGSAGWMPLIYISNTGQRPPASDAPSMWWENVKPWLPALAGAVVLTYLMTGKGPEAFFRDVF